MPMKTEVDGEFFFDINQYLIDNYPKMSLPDRRAICSLSLEVLDTDELESQIQEVISQYALEKLGYIEPETNNE
tara:strand:- start:2203 stop:2424 length:222 start_codon:yes stop_codon:yes gene_type:complete